LEGTRGKSTISDKERDVIRYTIFECIEKISFAFQVITSKNVIDAVCSDLNIIKSSTLKAMSRGIFFKFLELGGLERKQITRRNIYWKETKKFRQILNYLRLNISSFNRSQNHKGWPEMKLEEDSDSLFPEEVVIENISDNKEAKIEPVEESKSSGVEIKIEPVEKSNSDEFDDLELEEKLDRLNLTTDDIGSIIINMFKTSTDMIKEIEELKEEAKANIHDGELSATLQANLNTEKRKIIALEQEIERLSPAQNRMLTIKKALDAETEKKNEFKEEIKKLKKHDVGRGKHIESLNSKINSLESDLNKSKELAMHLTFTLEQSQLKLKKKEKKETVSLNDFSELHKVRDNFK
jgi:hypothetical protein